jgi:hypothetical protein
MRLLSVVAAALVVLGCATAREHRASSSPPANLVLVTVDSLRPDRLRLWNRDDGVATPNLEGLAARGALFRNAWATAPWTAPSVVSIFTGLYPPSHGVVMRDDTTSSELPTLARLLARQGYRLGNFSFFSGISYFRNLGLPECRPGCTTGRWLALSDSGSARKMRWYRSRSLPGCTWSSPTCPTAPMVTGRDQ